MEKTNCHHSKQRTDYLVSAISGVIPSWYTRPRVQAQTHLAFWRPRETRTQTLILFFAGNAGPTLLFTSVSASCCFWITKRRENKRDRSCLWSPFRRRLRVGLPLCGWNSGADAFPFFFLEKWYYLFTSLDRVVETERQHIYQAICPSSLPQTCTALRIFCTRTPCSADAVRSAMMCQVCAWSGLSPLAITVLSCVY